jgi:peptidoglycan/xylan/chitin deacetylase (PgdA/CDA1 family)
VPAVAGALGLARRIDDPVGVAITFDDGPHPEGTPAVLEALRDADVRGTFFLCGEQVERHPALAAEIGAAGHTVALHGHRHRNMLRLAPSTFVDDLERGIAAIEEATCRDLDAGDVLLLHDADHYSEPGCFHGTVAALPMVAERIRSAGLRPVVA